jgi:AmmeMemoRadiSam system protein A
MTDDRGQILLKIARSAIGHQFGLPEVEVPAAEWLTEKKATFVTLHLFDELKGCIGSIRAYRPLREDVHQNAISAAFEDYRFEPLKSEEFTHLEVEVSVLSPLKEMTFSSEEDALSQFRPGIDGILFECGSHRATYLPQVWEKLPNRRSFLWSLKQKAGLPENFWDSRVRLHRYTLEKYEEKP